MKWAMQIINGLDYLHEIGVVHRDLRSVNILVKSCQTKEGIHNLSLSQHPNVIRCVEFISQAPAIVMEIAGRGSLRDYLFEIKNPIGKNFERRKNCLNVRK